MEDIDGGMMTKFKIYNPVKDLGDRYNIYFPNEETSTASFKTDLSGIDSDMFYKMDTYPRGRLIIINIKNFHPKTGLDEFPREGTEKDARELTRLFLALGFIVECFDDLNRKELKQVMTMASYDDYSNMGALICTFLTHGHENIIFATDESIEIKKLTRLFRGSNLAGKPKIFIIQACQGSDYMNSLDEVDGKTKIKPSSLPIEADFLLAYSTAKGFYSWRNSQTGSWFIQTLCSVFRKHAHNTDIIRMLTKVNRIIAERKSQTNIPETHDRRQVSSTVSQFRKEFYFFPPFKESVKSL